MNPRAKLTQPRLYKSAIALAALSTLSALCAAQTAAPAPAAAASAARGETLDTVVITGFRSSLESALNKKREDNGIVDVIRAEDMGKFPDTNLAESLQRVPGVVIDRDAGEGRNITVRGLGGDFTRTRINGIEALATTGGTDSSGGANRSRTFDFNVFPADLFSTLTVRKSSSADVEEGSLGATVDLQTARPFDMKGRTANFGIKANYNDLAGSTSPKVNFLLADTFFDKKLGVMLGGAYSKRKVFEEGFSTVRWDNGPSSTGWCSPVGVTPVNPAVSASLTSTAANCATGVPRLPNTPENVAAYNTASSAANFHPRLPRYGRLTHEQERLGLSGAVQLRPADGTLLTLDLMYSKLDATRQEDFLQAISFSRNAGQGGKPQTSVVATEYDAAGRLLYGKYNGVDIRAESRYDELSTTFTQPTLTVEQDIGESLKLTAKLGRAQSKFRNPVQTTTTLDAINVNGYEIDFRGDDRLPKITYPFDVTAAGGPLQLVGVPVATSGTQATTVPNTTTSEIRIRPQGSTNTNDVLALNMAWEAIPDKLSFKVGSDYKKFTMNSYEFRRVNQSDTIFPVAAGTSSASLTTMVTGFGKGQSLPAGTPTAWVIPNLAAIAQAYDIYCNCIKSGPAGGPGDFTLSSVTNGNARGNNRDVVEKDTGGFLMADFRTELGGIPLRGNVGVRHVKTDVSSTGYQALAGGTAVTVDNSYSDTLPSVNVAANLSRDLIVRLAAAKVMSRPTLGLLNPGGTISSTGTLSITNGNPLLKPFRAKTFDGSVEWYFQKNAFLGLGLFEKKISTYIQTVRQNMPFNQTGLPLSLLPSNFTGDEVFQVTAPINTEGGKLSGLELNYQQPFTFLPAWGKNFGMLVNYTYVKSKIAYVVSPTSTATVTDDLINLSPRSMNGTLYYDDGTFSARVSASKRASFLQRVPGQNNNDVEGKNETLNVDLSISYKVTSNLDITLEGSNLTNQPNDQFISRARDSVVVNNVTGREYQIGMRYKF